MRSVCSLLSHVAGLATFSRSESADALGRINCNASAYMCAAALAMVLAPALSARAQCGPQWLPIDSASYFNHYVYTVGSWDSDGPGPARPVVVTGGSFTAVGAIPASRIAMWDGVAWHPLGPGFQDDVLDVVSHPDGRLIVGGRFDFGGGGGSPLECCVGVWDGSTWDAVGSGVNNTVVEVDVLSNGDIVAGGLFTLAGGAHARRIALWNGIAWAEVGGGFASGSVQAIGVLPNGDFLVGGSIPGRLRGWNGSSWYTIDGGALDNAVQDISPNPDGGFDIAGNFTQIGSLGVNHFARNDGINWSACGNGFNTSTVCSVRMPNGDIIVGGSFGALPSGPDTRGVVRWNGSSWSALGAGMNDSVTSLHVSSSGELIAVGVFTEAGGLPAQRFARWSETGIPWIAYQPEDRAVEVGEDVVLSSTPATSYSGVTYQWRKDGVDIDGAVGTLATPTNGQPALLVIESALPSDAGEYSVVFTNPCGSVSSDTVGVSVSGLCPADYNASGSAGDVLDFLDFFDDFGACVGRPGPCGEYGDADVNGDTIVDVLDFLDFLDAFGQGC